MFDFIAFILIFLEITLAGKFLCLIITLPYILYLINQNSLKTIIYIPLLILIYSFQNEKIALFSFFFLIFSLIFFIILLHLKYSKENIVIFSFINILFVYLFFSKYLSLFGIVLNFIGFLIVNYIFISKLKGKSEIGEK